VKVLCVGFVPLRVEAAGKGRLMFDLIFQITGFVVALLIGFALGHAVSTDWWARELLRRSLNDKKREESDRRFWIAVGRQQKKGLSE
jgi:hypothetical protein